LPASTIAATIINQPCRRFSPRRIILTPPSINKITASMAIAGAAEEIVPIP